MTIHSPAAYWFLLPLVLVLAWTLWNKKKKTPTLQFGSIQVLKTITPSVRTRLLNLPLFLKALAVVFAIMALARPQEMNTKIKKMSRGLISSSP